MRPSLATIGLAGSLCLLLCQAVGVSPRKGEINRLSVPAQANQRWLVQPAQPTVQTGSRERKFRHVGSVCCEPLKCLACGEIVCLSNLQTFPEHVDLSRDLVQEDPHHALLMPGQLSL